MDHGESGGELKMRLVTALVGGLLAAASMTPTWAQAPDQPSWAQKLRAMISADRIGNTIEDMTAHPDFPGSPWDKRNAEKTLALFQSWGWDAHMEVFPVMFPLPAERQVRLLGPKPFTARLHEPPVAGDPYSRQQSEQLASYFVYGPDGDVTAPLVYVNYGLREDYDELARMGVSAKGAIVIMRAGRMWRGGKVQLASEHGARAVLIYSDPQDDGYYRGPTYPAGGWRNGDSVQRGSILNGSHAGDPFRVFDGPKAGQEVAIDDPASSVARIPAMPLSYSDAQPLLAALKGPTAPDSWKGALPLTYRAGPGPAVHLRIKYRWEKINLYDVVATLRGSTYPDEWVVRGNHRDGWVYGAQDPHSGHSAMLEEARALGELLKQGWRPKRTLIYTSWDAEEQGTLGSAAWVEAHLNDLRQHAVAYINTDVIGPGTLRLGGAASFSDFLSSVAKQVTDPDTGVSAFDRLRVQAEAQGEPTGSGRESGALGLGGGLSYFDLKTNQLRLAPPGYGSDHAAFVGHAGVPALLLEFGSQVNLGSYHSIYDDFTWYKQYGDPGFKYGRATAQFDGSAVLGLTSADLLPMAFTATANALDVELRDLNTLYADDRKQRIADDRDVDLHLTQILQDPANPRLPPERRPIENLDLDPIQKALMEVHRAAARFDQAKKAADLRSLTRSEIERANAKMLDVEHAFLRAGGLPHRRYYENEFYSPGRLWDTVPMPAIGDAILDDHWDVARAQVAAVTATLHNIAAAMDAATLSLAPAVPQS